MSTYFAILTQVGEAKLANAIALGQTLKLKKMGVGDGNGALPIPDRMQKALVREVRRADLNQLAIDPANPSQIIAEQVLPEEVGGWWIREIGLYDEAGDLCAVANCPPSYKPVMAEGSARTQVVRVVLIVASTAAIELKIDPSIVLATRGYVEQYAAKIGHQHDAADVVSGVFSIARIPQLAMSRVTGLQEALAGKAPIDLRRHTIVPASRLPNVVYTNSTGRVMHINAGFIQLANSQFHAMVLVKDGGAEVHADGDISNSNGGYGTRASVIVLPGETYQWNYNVQLTVPTLQFWRETY
ncbi:MULTISPECIES: phage tail protein [unclassified Janthinobacterium]|uniref:phage tail protein n=1 Tax=unclassified Janthinobacterium TaxID=2610881 RepID=UPI001E3A309C|nr:MULTISPECIES: phage tail protein [unclassified Janthinobacterium]MCC7641426.1 phage tail protein [Janthinobacterium sp. EB271-G4-3-1]MCC7690680.1 phage tail protein [Janthinobacterium sp. EB271-G4-3-2]